MRAVTNGFKNPFPEGNTVSKKRFYHTFTLQKKCFSRLLIKVPLGLHLPDFGYFYNKSVSRFGVTMSAVLAPLFRVTTASRSDK